jgi:hypothetical protein
MYRSDGNVAEFSSLMGCYAVSNGKRAADILKALESWQSVLSVMLNMNALQSSETSEAINQPTRRNIPENPQILELRLQTNIKKYLRKALKLHVTDKLKLTSIVSRRP